MNVCLKCGKNTAVFKYKDQLPMFCYNCKEPKTINIYSTFCFEKDCHISASYNYPNCKANYCFIHKLEGMINIKKKCCEYENCNNSARYGYPGCIKLLCEIHKSEGMVNLKTMICQFRKCDNKASHGFTGSYYKEYCIFHITKDKKMIDYSLKRCLYIGCDNCANYSYDNANEAMFCQEHMKPEMIENFKQKCIKIGCRRYATHNNNNLFCYIHAMKKENLEIRRLDMDMRYHPNLIVSIFLQKYLVVDFYPNMENIPSYDLIRKNHIDHLLEKKAVFLKIIGNKDSNYEKINILIEHFKFKEMTDKEYIFII